MPLFYVVNKINPVHCFKNGIIHFFSINIPVFQKVPDVSSSLRCVWSYTGNVANLTVTILVDTWQRQMDAHQ